MLLLITLHQVGVNKCSSEAPKTDKFVVYVVVVVVVVVIIVVVVVLLFVTDHSIL